MMTDRTSLVVEPRSDSALLRRFAEVEDQDAFREVVERYSNFVRGVCVRKLGTHSALADDATQAVFMVLARKAKSLSDVEHLGGWLHRTAVFVASRMGAKERTQQDARLAMCVNSQGVEERDTCDIEAQTAAQARLDEAIQSLRCREREVTLGHYMLGRSYEVLAEQLGCTVEYVRVIAGRARERIRLKLRSEGVALSSVALVAVLDQIEAVASQKSLIVGRWSVGDGGAQVRTVVDAVMTEMDRAAAKAMWGKIGAVAAGLATIGVGTALVVSHFLSAPVAAISWRVESVVGNALAKRGEVMEELKTGDTLRLGDTILTSSNQEVTVASSDGNRISLRECGTLTISDRLSTLGLTGGAAVIDVGGQPLAIATERGRAEFQRGRFHIVALEGFVRIASWSGCARLTGDNGRTVETPAGMTAAARTNGVTAAQIWNRREWSALFGGVFYREFADCYKQGRSVFESGKFMTVGSARRISAKTIADTYHPESGSAANYPVQDSDHGEKMDVAEIGSANSNNGGWIPLVGKDDTVGFRATTRWKPIAFADRSLFLLGFDVTQSRPWPTEIESLFRRSSNGAYANESFTFKTCELTEVQVGLSEDGVPVWEVKDSTTFGRDKSGLGVRSLTRLHFVATGGAIRVAWVDVEELKYVDAATGETKERRQLGP